MGIKKYISYLKRKYKDIVDKLSDSQILNSKIESLSIDFNSIFHKSAGEIYGYGLPDKYDNQKLAKETAIGQAKGDPTGAFNQMNAEIFNKLVRMNNLLKAKNFILAADGPIPVAKLMQQKQRRYAAIKENRDRTVFDSNAFTPGTVVMELIDLNLKVQLENWFRLDIIEGQNKDLPDKLIYSSYHRKGEGEHKITKFLKALSNEGIHIIMGDDSDLVMIGLVNLKKNYYILRQDQNGRSTGLTYEDPKFYEIFNIELLRQELKKDMPNRPRAPQDYVVFSFLFGNDFLPHSPTLTIDNQDMTKNNSYNVLYEVYNSLTAPSLTFEEGESSQINLSNLAEYLQRLANREQELLNRRAKRQFTVRDIFNPILQNTTKIVEGNQSASSNPNFTDKESTTTYNVDMQTYRKLYYDKISGIRGVEFEITDELREQRIERMCYQYLAGFFWIYKYYNQGMDAVNSNWFYPYFHAPMISDLAVYIAKPDLINYINYVLTPVSYNLSPVEQLLIVTPPQSKDLLPIQLQFLTGDIPDRTNLTDEEKSLLSNVLISPILDQFPTSIEFDDDDSEFEPVYVERKPFNQKDTRNNFRGKQNNNYQTNGQQNNTYQGPSPQQIKEREEQQRQQQIQQAIQLKQTVSSNVNPNNPIVFNSPNLAVVDNLQTLFLPIQNKPNKPIGPVMNFAPTATPQVNINRALINMLPNMSTLADTSISVSAPVIERKKLDWHAIPLIPLIEKDRIVRAFKKYMRQDDFGVNRIDDVDLELIRKPATDMVMPPGRVYSQTGYVSSIQGNRGGFDSNRGRGNYRGRGGFDSNRGRGGFDSNRGRGGFDSNRGRGGFDSNRGRGGNYRGRGGFDSNRGSTSNNEIIRIISTETNNNQTNNNQTNNNQTNNNQTNNNQTNNNQTNNNQTNNNQTNNNQTNNNQTNTNQTNTNQTNNNQTNTSNRGRGGKTFVYRPKVTSTVRSEIVVPEIAAVSPKSTISSTTNSNTTV
jgi:hypothetical protein